jgi:hypothetical protein
MKVAYTQQENREFKIPPVGYFLARCYQIIDLGTQTGDYMGKVTMQRKIKVYWELHGDDLKTDDGKPLIQTRNYTLSLGEKASLRKDLESWRGKPFTDGELRTFDTDSMLDKWCMITIQHRTGKDGNTYADPAAITPVPESIIKAGIPKGINPIFTFDISEYGTEKYEKLSKSLKEKVMLSAEIRNSKNTSLVDVNKKLQEAAIVDDDVPF